MLNIWYDIYYNNMYNKYWLKHYLWKSPCFVYAYVCVCVCPPRPVTWAVRELLDAGRRMKGASVTMGSGSLSMSRQSYEWGSDPGGTTPPPHSNLTLQSGVPARNHLSKQDSTSLMNYKKKPRYNLSFQLWNKWSSRPNRVSNNEFKVTELGLIFEHTRLKGGK